MSRRGIRDSLFFAALLMVLILPGCVSTGNLGLVVRSMASPADLLTESHSFRQLGPAEGRACRFFVVAIVPFGDSTVSAAVDDALQKSGGDALVNVSTSSSLYGFIPIYNVLSFTCTTVRGTAIAIGPPPGGAPPR